MKRVRVLTSHAAHHRFLAECQSGGERWMARKHCPVRTPWTYSATVICFRNDGRFVWIAETAQRRYEVWQVPESLLHFTDKAAEIENFNDVPGHQTPMEASR